MTAADVNKHVRGNWGIENKSHSDLHVSQGRTLCPFCTVREDPRHRIQGR